MCIHATMVSIMKRTLLFSSVLIFGGLTSLWLAGQPSESLAASQLIKGESNSAVYELYNGKRYAFPNEKVFFTWHSNFSEVQTITDTALANIALGGNVTYRPGVKMIKIISDPKVYAVSANATLRWITSEALARAYYGDRWQQEVHDVSDAFFVNYTTGNPIANLNDFNPVGEMNNATTFVPPVVITNPVVVAPIPVQPQPIPITPPPQPPTPIPTRAGSFKTASQFLFPQKAYQVRDWQITYTPDLGFHDQSIRIIVTTNDFAKRGNIISMKANLTQYEQNPATGLGRTEDIVFYNDGTHGDEHSNDAWFTSQISLESWYGPVDLTSLTIDLRDGSHERLPTTGSLVGVTFMAFDQRSDQATIFEADHGVAVFPSSYSSAAQAFAQGVDTCYGGLLNQLGSVTFRNEKAYYTMRIANGYLETGGFINRVSGPVGLFQNADPTAPEWRDCSPITAHELTHSITSDVRKPTWAEEGFAEYTSRKATNLPSFCEATGWRESASSPLRPYVSLSKQIYVNGHGDVDGYNTAVCAFNYIEDTYGAGAVQNIYRSMQQSQDYESQNFCSPSHQFYRDIIYPNTSSNIRQILRDRFLISDQEQDCAS